MKLSLNRHPVQLHILERLRTAGTGLRYSDMRPDEIENDLYNYHLRYLVGQGLVEKSDGNRYRMSLSGKRYLMELNPVTELGESHRFKLASLCLALRNAGPGLEALYQRRARQPHAGEVGIIGGGIKRGEPAVAAANRRLWEEAGLAGNFTLLGMVRKRYFDPAGEIFSDILFHVCVCTDSHGQLVAENEFGLQLWLPIDKAIGIETNGQVGSPQLARVLEQLKTTPPGAIPMFYFDETYHAEIY
jgi:8-oxo-dGTP pyrophosphatase MutT (NUDIX family)